MARLVWFSLGFLVYTVLSATLSLHTGVSPSDVPRTEFPRVEFKTAEFKVVEVCGIPPGYDSVH